MKPVARVSVGLALAFLGAWVVAAEPAAPAKADPAKGATIAAGTCAACHTSDGSRGIAANPILQGQHADYLARQLADYKSGKRDNPIRRAGAPLRRAETKTWPRLRQKASQLDSPRTGFAHGESSTAGRRPMVLPSRRCHSTNGDGIPARFASGGPHPTMPRRSGGVRNGKRRTIGEVGAAKLPPGSRPVGLHRGLR